MYEIKKSVLGIRRIEMRNNATVCSLCARGNLCSILNNITMYLHIYLNN